MPNDQTCWLISCQESPSGRSLIGARGVTCRNFSPPLRFWSSPKRCIVPWLLQRGRGTQPGNGWGRPMGWAGVKNIAVEGSAWCGLWLIFCQSTLIAQSSFKASTQKSSSSHISVMFHKPGWSTAQTWLSSQRNNSITIHLKPCQQWNLTAKLTKHFRALTSKPAAFFPWWVWAKQH